MNIHSGIRDRRPEEQQVEIGFAGRIIGAEEVNGVEKTIGKAVVKDNKLCFSIRPYSLKTFKVKLQLQIDGC